VELRLVVETRGQPPREVAVEAEPHHLVREVARAVAAHLGASEPLDRLRLYSQRAGGWLDPEAEVREADLRWGDRLTLAPSLPREAARPDVLVDLVVLSGPSAGLREPLPPGEHRVGSFRYSGTVLDDPTVSRVHLVATVTRFGAVTVQDADSESGTFLDGRRIAGPTPVQPGQVLVLGRSVITFERRDPTPGQDGRAQPVRNTSGRIAFNRPPRVAQPAPQTGFGLEDVPTRSRGFHMPLSTALVPLAMGIVMYLAYRTLYMLLFALLSPAMVIFSLAETAFPNRLSFGRAMRRFRRRLRELDQQMAGAAAAEDAYRRLTAPDPPAVLDRARRLDPSLWERRPDDPDWLTLRVGWADQPSSVSLKLPEDKGLPALRAEAEQVAARHRVLRSAPMTVSLKEVGVLGLAGDAAQVLAIARWLAVQLAVLHSPEDLVIAAAVPSTSRAEWAWLGWLPHLHSETSPVQQPLLVGDRIAARELLDRLLALVTEREQATQPGGQVQRFGASVVAFVHEGVELPRGTASVLLERGPAVGVHVIWLSAVAQDLPGACGAVVELQQGAGLPVLTFPASGATLQGGGAEGVSERLARDLALQLAPVRDVSSRSRQAGVPRRVSFLELLGLQEAAESTIMANWVRDRSMPDDRPLSATWGVADGGMPFSVSIRLDGPHALVGGTTGAGKSELLQAFVAALATAHSPRTLNFLLVDYKGGAAFKDCVDLPHTVGFVTDLDGHLVNRALVSLRAELRRREEILREVGGKDLIDLERRFPDVAPASLLIVVDEFAALVSELPEFVDGMVDVAQRGRSLGIHLVLATQRPAGVIGDKIRANTPLRVSLRFADAADSQDVIGTKDAARPGLPPGRAFALTGGEVTEFQAAYVGGRTAAAGSSGPAAVQVRDLGFGGVVLAPPERRTERREPQTGQTDLQRLVAAINVVNRRLALPPPFRPWLPTLPEVIALDSLPAARAGGLRAVLGAIDDPAGQRQLPLEFDLAGEGNLLVYGASGSGKTTALRTLACSLAMHNGPDRLHVYALDFATRGLRPLEALPHCGGVITEDQTERAVRLLGTLRAEADRRKGLFANVGAATLAEYRAARPAEPVPSILCLLDGYSNFAPAFEKIDGGDWLLVLRALVSEGRPLGIAFAIANDRQAPHFTSISNSIARRLILRLASEDEYALWGLPHWLVADAHLPPGRGFTERALEAHVACVGPDPSGSGQAAAVVELGGRLRAQAGPASVPEIRTLPTGISRASLPRPAAALEAVVGIGDRDLQPLRLDLSEGHFVVTGPRRSGRTTTLAAIAASLAAGPGRVDLHLLCPRRQSPLAGLRIWTNVALGEDACAELAGRLAGEAKADESGQASRAAVLIVDDGDDMLQGGPSLDLEWIAQRGVEHGMHIVTAVDAQSISRAFGSWLPVALRDRQGLMLDPDVLDGQNFGVRLPHRSGAFPLGRGYVVRRGEVELVQVAGD
jgi:S-DNA-T family DNA segregation ATPase FtsK/SpoIIIE